MAKLETLEDFLRRKEIKPYDMVNINSLYSENKEIKLSPEITGHNKSQTFCREESLKFFFAYGKDGSPILYGDTTKTTLYLEGKIGAKCGASAANLACVPYSNLEKGIYTRATTEEDIINVRNTEEGRSMLEEILIHVAWLGSSYVKTRNGNVECGVYIVDGGYVRDRCLYSFVATGGGYHGVRPAISLHLPSGIYVDKERSENGKWVLVPERM